MLSTEHNDGLLHAAVNPGLDFKAILYKAALDLVARAVCRSEAGRVAFRPLDRVDKLCLCHFTAFYPEFFCLSFYLVDCHIFFPLLI